MQLESILKVRMGLKECTAVAAYALDRDDVYMKLLDFVEHGNDAQAMKASWVMGHIRRLNQSQSLKYQDKLIQLLQQASIGGVQRELLKSLEGLTLKESNEASLLNFAWNGLSNLRYDVAVRHACLTVLRFYCKRFPELREELKAIEVIQREKTGRFP
jgi:hypothetical protein